MTFVSPISTGGGGNEFEKHVQAYFVVLMLTNGYVPCLSASSINKIKLQGRCEGYNTDDIIVFIKEGSQERKLLGQIKLSIAISKKGEFKKAIKSAWSDFNNIDLFKKDRDAIALMVGISSANKDIRRFLELTRACEDSVEFQQSNVFNKKQIKIRDTFKESLKDANGGNDVSDDELYDFLKHFHFLAFDLDIKSGVDLSLLYSLIGQYSPGKEMFLWARILEWVGHNNRCAGTISRKNLPDDIQNYFETRYDTIPSAIVSQLPSDIPDWNRSRYAEHLVTANLLGAWDEQNEADRKIISQIAREGFDSWIKSIGNILQEEKSPISLRNGKWRVSDRKELWKELGARIFNSHLELFKISAIEVLSEKDPQFELSSDTRYFSNIYGKQLKHSAELRKGMAESLALLGNQPDDLTHITINLPKNITVSCIREIFQESDWVIWCSLKNLLPTLAEVAPNEFLEGVENSLANNYCPFDDVFAQEKSGVLGNSYISGLLWALETLAWEEGFLVRVCLILGKLAVRDPGGNYINRPANSLINILLPWQPKTTAPIKKRKVAVRTLKEKFPTIAWGTLIGLLPNALQISVNTPKPSWRNTVYDGRREVELKDYWEQILFYADIVVSMARDDVETNKLEKMNELVDHLDNFKQLPDGYFDKILDILSSASINQCPENERLNLWEKLTQFILKHRKYSDTEWALNSDIISKIEKAVSRISPSNPLDINRRLFGNNDTDLYEESTLKDGVEIGYLNRNLTKKRQQAVKEILDYGGIDKIIEFSTSVKDAECVGFSLGDISEAGIEEHIIPKFLESHNKNLVQFVKGYVLSSHSRLGKEWIDKLDISDWSPAQKGHFLSFLPFNKDTWDKVEEWLGKNENEYWSRATIMSYRVCDEFEYAVDKLLECGRPNAVIDLLYCCVRLDKNNLLNKKQCVKALLAMASSKGDYYRDTYHISEIIKFLQNDPDVNPEDLCKIEWAYLSISDLSISDSEFIPKQLENRLASDPSFFCELINILFRPEGQIEKASIDTAVANNANNVWRLFYKWRTPPSTQHDGKINGQEFLEWLKIVKENCAQSGHLKVALSRIGNVLFYCPPDSDGLWIDRHAADVLNADDSKRMCEGFTLEAFNSRGMHQVDPEGKPEKELARHYREKAEAVENAGYTHFANALKKLAESYENEAKNVIDRCKDDSYLDS